MNSDDKKHKDVLPLKIFDGAKISISSLTEASVSYIWLRRIKEIFLAMYKVDERFVQVDMDIAKQEMHDTCDRYIESVRPSSSTNE
ncbi:unnamed protein product, partial [Didymodactylos carnosus]